MSLCRLLLASAIAVALPLSPALALPPAPEIAPLLEGWQPWVLHDDPELLCASVGTGKACVWPGHLSVKALDKGGSFELDVWLDRSAVVRLPGDKSVWPLDMRADGAAAVVLASDDGLPELRLPAGHHRVSGAFSWAEIPELLTLPADVGAVDLSLRGAVVEHPRRDEAGRLLVQKDGGSAAAETDSLSIAVSRRLVDGVPLALTTRLVLRVGGKAREALLGPVLPDGFRPTQLQSPLPAQLGGDGALRVHVRPGTYTVELTAVLPEAATAVAVPRLQGEPWESPETWVWVPDEALRSVEIGGLALVDPERTQLADDWKKGRCLLGEAGQTLTLKTTRRGEAEAAPNQLKLERAWWLDLDGGGITSHDVLTGDMHQAWQVQAAPGWRLGRAAVSGQDQLVTLGQGATATAAAGVELRTGNLRVEADLRIQQRGGAIRAVGWNADVQSLRTVLHLPPGYKLLGASGVDQLPQTWLDSWTLFDFFFVLLLTIGLGRLLGWGWGALGMVTLVLCHAEPGAPEALWVFALAGLGLLAVLPASWFRKAVGAAYAGVLVLLICQAVPFAAGQLRGGLYPQVGRGDDDGLAMVLGTAEVADKVAQAPEAEPAAPPAPEAAENKPELKENAAIFRDNESEDGGEVPGGGKAGAVAVQKQAADQRDGYGSSLSWRGRASKKAQVMQQIDPQAVVQTGPGVPTWQWTAWPLTWSGPVRADHEIELYLLSPPVNLALAVLRAVLVLLLTLRLLDLGRLRRLIGALQVPAGMALVLLAVGLGLPARPVQAAEAPLPSAELLETLHKRLVAAQQCEGPCLVASHLELRVDGQNVRVSADLSAQRPAAWSVPGPQDALEVHRVLIDEQPTRDLRRDPQGLLQVRVPAGHHTVMVEGVLPRRSVVDLQMGADTLAHKVTFVSAEWSIDGLDASGTPQQSVQLTRRERPAALPGAATSGEAAEVGPDLPPWFTVERHLQIALPWEVHTSVLRTQSERPLLVKIPLLAGEVVLTDGVRVEEVEPGHPERGRRALVNFARGASVVVFDSQLPMPDGPAATLQLSAPRGEPWSEQWRLDCSPIWRCSWPAAGEAKAPRPEGALAPDYTRDPGDQALRPLWRPWPGETLAIAIERPRGAPGQSVTVDRATLRVTPGQRLLAGRLTMHIRASQGGWQKLTLPPEAEVQTVTCKGQQRNLRPRGRELQIPLEPGAQEIVVTWQQPWARSLSEHVPALHLGGPATNVTMELELGQDRWLLWTRGPAWGAAVLFWSRLVLVILAALALGRLRGLPLTARHWLGLGLGLAPLPMPLTLVVVGWFVVLGWRRRYGIVGVHGDGKHLDAAMHNLLQLTLAGWTLAALGTLYAAIHQNLLLDVDMQVGGLGSTCHLLRWYVDRTDGALPDAVAWSLPLWVWRALMLAWALWLVLLLTRALPWAWRAFSAGGAWKPLTGKANAAPVPDRDPAPDRAPVPAPAPVPAIAQPPTPPPPGRAPLPERKDDSEP